MDAAKDRSGSESKRAVPTEKKFDQTGVTVGRASLIVLDYVMLRMLVS